MNESMSYKKLGDECLKLETASCSQIFDQGVFEQGENDTPVLDFERRLESGLLMQAEGLEKVAELLKLRVEALVETVRAYNESVDKGDDPLGRRNLVHQHGELRRTEQAPYYIYPSTTCVFGIYCGLNVTAAQVLDVFGEAIEGLYAAGETIGGFHGGAYMTGSALGKAAVFGLIAGRTIAAV
jgi:fumarate reductase flavoprotein subunit